MPTHNLFYKAFVNSATDHRIAEAAERLGERQPCVLWAVTQMLSHTRTHHTDGRLRGLDARALGRIMNLGEIAMPCPVEKRRDLCVRVMRVLVEVGILELDTSGVFGVVGWSTICPLTGPIQRFIDDRRRRIAKQMGLPSPSRLPQNMRRLLEGFEEIERAVKGGPPLEMIERHEERIQRAIVRRDKNRRRRVPDIASAGECRRVPERCRKVPGSAGAVPERVPDGTLSDPLDTQYNASYAPLRAKSVAADSISHFLSPSPSLSLSPREVMRSDLSRPAEPASAVFSFSLKNSFKEEKKLHADDYGEVQQPDPTVVANDYAGARETAPIPDTKNDENRLPFAAQVLDSGDHEVPHVERSPGRTHTHTGESDGLERLGGLFKRVLSSPPRGRPQPAGAPQRVASAPARVSYAEAGRSPPGAVVCAAGGAAAAAAAQVVADAPQPIVRPVPVLVVDAETVIEATAVPSRPDLTAEPISAAPTTALVLWRDPVTPESSVPYPLPPDLPKALPPPPRDEVERFAPRPGESAREAHWRNFCGVANAYIGRLTCGTKLFTRKQLHWIYLEVRSFPVSIIEQGLRLNEAQDRDQLAKGGTSMRYNAGAMASHCKRLYAHEKSFDVAQEIADRKPSDEQFRRSHRNALAAQAWLDGGMKGPPPDFEIVDIQEDQA